MPSETIPKKALRWTPNEGGHRRGRPKQTRRRSFEQEMKENGLTCAQAEHSVRKTEAQLLTLCATGHEED